MERLAGNWRGLRKDVPLLIVIAIWSVNFSVNRYGVTHGFDPLFFGGLRYLVAGVFFDTHASTPFGLTAMVGMVLAYAASRLGKEGVGDLDSAAWWVTPLLAAVGGFAAPLLYVIVAFLTLHFATWRAGTIPMMGVNAVAFLVLARPVSRLARFVGNVGVRVRR